MARNSDKKHYENEHPKMDDLRSVALIELEIASSEYLEKLSIIEDMELSKQDRSSAEKMIGTVIIHEEIALEQITS